MNSHPRNAGMALVLVLWVISLMTIMAGSFALSTQREAGILSHAHERAKALALAEGGVHYAMMMLSLPDPKKRWLADGTPYTWRVDGARVQIRIMDEGGKIDLNAAQEATLKTVFQLVTRNEELATSLTDRILDWRDPDDLKRTHGAEAEDYQSLRMNAAPQNRNFLIMDELRGVMGITPDLYRKLESWFTLYTGDGGLNPAKAAREILLPLMGGDAAAVDNYLLLRRQSAQGIAPPPLPPLPGMSFGGSGDVAYTVQAIAEIEDQQGAGVLATIRRGPAQDGTPFTTLRWKATVQPAKAKSQDSTPTPQARTPAN